MRMKERERENMNTPSTNWANEIYLTVSECVVVLHWNIIDAFLAEMSTTQKRDEYATVDFSSLNVQSYPHTQTRTCTRKVETHRTQITTRPTEYLTHFWPQFGFCFSIIGRVRGLRVAWLFLLRSLQYFAPSNTPHFILKMAFRYQCFR